MQSIDLISEFDAAQEVQMSPILLRWFTSYSAKGDGRKLKFTIKDGVYFYEKIDLFDFNTYLNLPWKKPSDGSRPPIPTGIATEVKTESHYRCPLCNTNVGELAHIKPVSKSFSNHPHNLIFLCPTHHTVYDFGFKYKNVTKKDILIHKRALQSFQSLLWGLQNKIVYSYLSLVNIIGRAKDLEKILSKATTEAEFEKLFESILKKMDSKKKDNPKADGIAKIIDTVDTSVKSTSKQVAYSYLSLKEKLKEENELDKNLVACKLCATRGFTEDFDICPACHGEGYVNKDNDINYSQYEFQECPLCKGKGETENFETCPPCNGDGRLTKEQIDNIDFSLYDILDCPLCKGKGQTKDFDDCPPCGGTGQLSREQIDNIDFSIYEMIECPLCHGQGQTKDFDDCPPCGGTGQLTREQIDNIDFSIYEMIDCPLCYGKGQTKKYDECPPCGGTGRLSKGQSESIDFDGY